MDGMKCLATYSRSAIEVTNLSLHREFLDQVKVCISHDRFPNSPHRIGPPLLDKNLKGNSHFQTRSSPVKATEGVMKPATSRGASINSYSWFLYTADMS